MKKEIRQPRNSDEEKNNVFYLVYLSKATHHFDDSMVTSIVSKSQENNDKINVGGCLIYENGLFLQILEGNQKVVMQLFTKIEGDSRHGDVTILKQGFSSKRSYPDWKMKNITKSEESQIFSAMNHLLSSLSEVYLVLERYTHPTIRHIISQGKDPMEKEPKKELKAIVFCDLVQFTDMTNKINPELHTQILNEFLGIISAITLNHMGNVVSFTGDCVFSEFDTAPNALDAATTMLQRMEVLNEKYHDIPIQLGIGLSYGEVLSGSFGSVHHAQYTMYSATVNRASRLEGTTRDCNYHMVFDKPFMDAVKKERDTDEIVFVDNVPLKGFEEKVAIYSISNKVALKDS